MRREWKEGKKSFFIIYAIFILFGVILTIWPLETTTTLCYMLGSIVLFYGLSKIWLYFSKAKDVTPAYRLDLIIGVLIASTGLFIFFKSESIISLLPIVIGLTLIIESLTKLQQALSLRTLQHPQWHIALLFAGITLAIGVLLLFNPFKAASLMIRIIGISLLYNGISGFWILWYILQYEKIQEPSLQEEVVHVEVIDSKDE
ncbi:MAG: DUF308 domain-containing protein [Erysipelotrichaceae bacterium]|nr:DUF308 domain-containing protein [Erysipelotrichaceae bacterium]